MIPSPTRNTSWGGTRRSFPPHLAKKILERANRQCQLRYPSCTHKATEADHIRPWSQGGTDTLNNGQAACTDCHRTKTAEERKHGQQRHSRKRQPPKHPGLT